MDSITDRARQSGSYAFVDIKIDVDKKTTVEISHQAVTNIKYKIKGKHDKVIDRLIHIDPVEQEKNMVDL